MSNGEGKAPEDNDVAQEFGESSVVEDFSDYSPEGDEALGESSLEGDELAGLDEEVSQQITDTEREEQKQSLTEQVLSGDFLGAAARALGGEGADPGAAE